MTELVMITLKQVNWKWTHTSLTRSLSPSIVATPTEDPDDKRAAFVGRLCTGISAYGEAPEIGQELSKLATANMSGLSGGSASFPLSVWTWAISRLTLWDCLWNSYEKTR